VRYRVILTAEAREDLLRLEDFLVEIAVEHGDFDLPARALDAIRLEFGILERNPFTCRMADNKPYERELVIPFGTAGYVALFEVVNDLEVFVTAVRHQREDEYH
jgi:hypothetical protein